MGGAAFFHLVSPFLRLYALVGMVLAAKRQRSVKEAAHQGTVGKRHQTQEGIIQQKLRGNYKHLGTFRDRRGKRARRAYPQRATPARF